MIKAPKKPLPSLLTVIGYPFAIALTIFSFFQVGFNIEDFKRNWENRKLVTDTLFNPKWEWAIEKCFSSFTRNYTDCNSREYSWLFYCFTSFFLCI